MSRLLVACIVSLSAVCYAQPQQDFANEAACRTDVSLLTMADGLLTTRQRLAQGTGLVIVAIGSSSTAGHGATTPDRCYPAQLGTLLRAQYPRQAINVLNRGVGGETAADMVARFERDVLAHRPQLVLWQTGANDALRGVDLAHFADTIDRGLALLRAHDLDVILIAPQYAPKLITAPNSATYLARMHDIATRWRVPIFRRYTIMRQLAESRPEALPKLLSADGLHHNDSGYHCLALQLATAIEPKRAASLVIEQR